MVVVKATTTGIGAHQITFVVSSLIVSYLGKPCNIEHLYISFAAH